MLPAEPDYGRIARVAASSLALRLGFTFAEVEDLRIAVDETVILLLRPAAAGEITIEFTVGRRQLHVDVSTSGGAGEAIDPGARRRFEEIVGETVDAMVIVDEPPQVHLGKRYRSAARPARRAPAPTS